MAAKVQTNKKNNFNQTVRFLAGTKNVLIKFDDEGIGVAENKDIAESLIESSDFIFEVGSIPSSDNKPKYEPTVDDTQRVIELRNKLNIAEQRISLLEKEKDIIESNLKDWKTEFSKIKEENDSLKKMVNIPSQDKKPEETIQEEESIEDQLSEKKVPELRDMCVKLEFDRGEWETLKKEELIKYLIEKTKPKE